MGNRSSMRADLRRDLRDEDSSSYIWTDAVLNRHIQHALDDLQAIAPRIAKLTPAGRGPADYRALAEPARSRFLSPLEELRLREAPPVWRPSWSDAGVRRC